jgi:hypothetical protein
MKSQKYIIHQIRRGYESLIPGGAEDRHFGVRYFGISDTRSSKGEGVVAARIAKSQNVKTQKHMEE